MGTIRQMIQKITRHDATCIGWSEQKGGSAQLFIAQNLVGRAGLGEPGKSAHRTLESKGEKG